MSQTTESQFSTDPAAPEAAEYRPVCGLAVVGLVLGAASAVALLGRPAWVIPALAVLLNLLALRQIAGNATPMIGRGLAIGGLLLAMFFAGTAVARDLTSQWVVREQAASAAKLWVDLMLENKVMDASRLEVNPAERSEPGPPRVDRAMFHHRSYMEVRQKLDALGKGATAMYLGDDQWDVSGDVDQVTCVFDIRGVEAAGDQPYYLAVFVKREAGYRPQPEGWMVEAVIGDYEPSKELLRTVKGRSS